MNDLLTNPSSRQDLESELDRLRHLVEMDRQLSVTVRGNANRQRQVRLAIGDALLGMNLNGSLGLNKGTGAQLEEAAKEAGLPIETARAYRTVAGRCGRAIRDEIDNLDVEVSYTTVRAAVRVPKSETGNRAEALQRRLEEMMRLARAAADSDTPVVTEIDLREALGDPMPQARRGDGAPSPRDASHDSGYWEPLPPGTGPAAGELAAIIGSSPENTQSACAALLGHSVGRAEVFARVLSTPEYLTELVANDSARHAIQRQIKTTARDERDPDDLAMDAAAEADPEVVLARWRAALQRRDAQAVRLLEYDPEEIALRGDEQLIDAVLTTAQMYGEWGERLAAAARREGPRAG